MEVRWRGRKPGLHWLRLAGACCLSHSRAGLPGAPALVAPQLWPPRRCAPTTGKSAAALRPWPPRATWQVHPLLPPCVLAPPAATPNAAPPPLQQRMPRCRPAAPAPAPLQQRMAPCRCAAAACASVCSRCVRLVAPWLAPAVDVRNAGYIPADYTVSVAECTSGVRPPVVRRRCLAVLPAANTLQPCTQQNSAWGSETRLTFHLHLAPRRRSAPASPPTPRSALPSSCRWRPTRPPTAAARVGLGGVGPAQGRRRKRYSAASSPATTKPTHSAALPCSAATAVQQCSAAPCAACSAGHRLAGRRGGHPGLQFLHQCHAVRAAAGGA